MKKILIYAFAICIALSTSCSKDNPSPSSGGGQTTSKRIDEIYKNFICKYYLSYDEGQTWTLIDSINEGIRPKADWHWENDQITSVDYYDYGDGITGTDTFFYNDEGLVSKLVYTSEESGMEIAEFTYDNNIISHIDYYYQDALDTSYDLTYSNGKLVRVTCTFMADGRNTPRHFKSLPTKDDELPFVELTWTGNNVTKVETFLNNGSDGYAIYTYDNNNNPYYGSSIITAYILGWDDPHRLSQNNVFTTTYYIGNYTETYTYSYDYLNNYPLQVSETHESIIIENNYWLKTESEDIIIYDYLTD